MGAQPKPYLTPDEYLDRERRRDYRSEYYAGQVFALAGGSRSHNLIVTNVIAELRNQLRRHPCRVYPNDMRVKVPQTGLYTYPDVVVTCGQDTFDDQQQDTLLNPTLIVEVLSKSTENFDRGRKFKLYRTLDSLAEYILISQHAHHIEHYVRQPDQQWLLSEADDLQATIHLPVIDCTLLLADVYEKVDIEAASEDSD